MIWIGKGRIWIGEGYRLGKAGYGLGKRKDMDLERGLCKLRKEEH